MTIHHRVHGYEGVGCVLPPFKPSLRATFLLLSHLPASSGVHFLCSERPLYFTSHTYNVTQPWFKANRLFKYLPLPHSQHHNPPNLTPNHVITRNFNHAERPTHHPRLSGPCAPHRLHCVGPLRDVGPSSTRPSDCRPRQEHHGRTSIHLAGPRIAFPHHLVRTMSPMDADQFVPLLPQRRVQLEPSSSAGRVGPDLDCSDSGWYIRFVAARNARGGARFTGSSHSDGPFWRCR